MTRRFTLKSWERLKKEDDFQRVFAARYQASNRDLSVYGCPNGLSYSRLGIAVGKRWGKSHVRNRLKRILREAYRLSKPSLPKGLDLVLVPRRAPLRLQNLLESLPHLARVVLAKCCKAPSPHVTRELGQGPSRQAPTTPEQANK